MEYAEDQLHTLAAGTAGEDCGGPVRRVLGADGVYPRTPHAVGPALPARRLRVAPPSRAGHRCACSGARTAHPAGAEGQRGA